MISDEEILAVADQCLYGGKDYGIIEFAHRIAELQRERDAELFDTEYLVRFEAAEIAAAIRSQGETK